MVFSLTLKMPINDDVFSNRRVTSKHNSWNKVGWTLMFNTWIELYSNPRPFCLLFLCCLDCNLSSLLQRFRQIPQSIYEMERDIHCRFLGNILKRCNSQFSGRIWESRFLRSTLDSDAWGCRDCLLRNTIYSTNLESVWEELMSK